MWNTQKGLTGKMEATFMDAPAKYSSVFDFAARVSLYFCRDF
jgi:nitrate reductase assembly molybdenum cofactor insertion protein NarJ